jgi:hypothetical protein
MSDTWPLTTTADIRIVVPQILAGDQETMMKKKQDENRLKIAVRVDPEDFAKLEELRIKEEKNVSAIIRRYIKEGLERDEKRK